MSRPAWGHAHSTIFVKGKTKVVCRCGKQSKFTDEQGVREWIETHRASYGLVEKPQGRRVQ